MTNKQKPMSKPQPPYGARCAATPIFGQFWPNYATSLQHPQIDIMGTLLLASGLRIPYMNFYPDWKKNCRVISQKPYVHLWTYAPNLIDFGP